MRVFRPDSRISLLTSKLTILAKAGQRRSFFSGCRVDKTSEQIPLSLLFMPF